MTFRSILIALIVNFAALLSTAGWLAAQVRPMGLGNTEGKLEPGDSRGFTSDFITRLDRNGDGNLTSDEMDERVTSMVRRFIPSADISRPIPISQLQRAFAEAQRERERRFGGGDRDNQDERAGGDGRSRGEDGRRRTAGQVADPEPLVPGFDPPIVHLPVPRFGAAEVALNANVTERDREEARRLLRQHDSSRDNQLDAAELQIARSVSDANQFDRNGDGNLSFAELTFRSAYRRIASERNAVAPAGESSTLSGDSARYLGRRGDPRERSEDGNNGRRGQPEIPPNTSGKKNILQEPAKPKSYRAKSPYERENFPKRLPSWFVERDVNLDGQVLMGEFSSAWNNEIVMSFQSFDLNSDGLITAKECADATANGVVLNRRLPASPPPVLAARSEPSSSRESHPAVAKELGQAAAPNETPTASASLPSTLPASYRQYASRVVQRYDLNNDGVLAPEECAKISKDLSAADADGNRAVTVDELAWWYVKQR